MLIQSRLTGTAEAGRLVQIDDHDQKLITPARTGAAGMFVATPAVALAKGKYPFVALKTDAGNNFGAVGLGCSLSIL